MQSKKIILDWNGQLWHAYFEDLDYLSGCEMHTYGDDPEETEYLLREKYIECMTDNFNSLVKGSKIEFNCSNE